MKRILPVVASLLLVFAAPAAAQYDPAPTITVNPVAPDAGDEVTVTVTGCLPVGAEVPITIDGVQVVAFGHIGDGNVHFNVMQPAGADVAAFLGRGGEITSRVHDIAAELDGSFSAEHGIGVLKKHELLRYKSSVELELMRTLKRSLDPKGIMNPGKIITQS